jgi:hypothetical protein
MERKQGVLALFAYVDDLKAALGGLKAESRRIETIYSPVPLAEAGVTTGVGGGSVRLTTLLGAIVGGLAVVGLAVYAHLSFRFIVGSKPILPWVPWVVVCFEGVILGGVLSAVAAWVFKGGLPRLKPMPGYDGAFSRDRFGVLVCCETTEKEQVEALLRKAGAEEVRHVAW